MIKPKNIKLKVPESILKDFDVVVENYGTNRSEYIRNLMRKEIIEFNKKKWKIYIKQ